MKLTLIALILALNLCISAFMLSHNKTNRLQTRIERLEMDVASLKKTLKFHKQALIDIGRVYDKVIPIDGGFLGIRKEKEK